jgi:hypothetical protein
MSGLPSTRTHRRRLCGHRLGVGLRAAAKAASVKGRPAWPCSEMALFRRSTACLCAIAPSLKRATEPPSQQTSGRALVRSRYRKSHFDVCSARKDYRHLLTGTAGQTRVRRRRRRRRRCRWLARLPVSARQRGARLRRRIGPLSPPNLGRSQRIPSWLLTTATFLPRSRVENQPLLDCASSQRRRGGFLGSKVPRQLKLASPWVPS